MAAPAALPTVAANVFGGQRIWIWTSIEMEMKIKTTP